MLSALTTHGFGIFILCITSMLVLWLYHLKSGKAAWMDLGWAFNFTLVILYLMIAYVTYAPSAVGLAFMYLFWSLRLSGHLTARIASSEDDDPRYVKLRNRWGSSSGLKILALFLINGASNILFSLPLFVLWSDPTAQFDGIRKFATLLWAFAVWAEGRSDKQLDQFKRDPKNHGKVCREGFWKYSRHPNYFFELLVWVSYALFALSSPGGWVAVLCPVLMYILITKVTGIPPNEEQNLKSKGEAYRNYQKSTSPLIPMSPKDA